MRISNLALLATVAATPLLAQETREMDAHVHGVSTLELAVEGGTLEMNLTSPGMDIVGFEYQASTDADKAAVEAALRKMLVPENIVALPEAAECRLTEVLAHIHGGDHDEDPMDDHADHDEHAEDDDHDHDEHAEGEDHDHEDHAEGEDDDHAAEHSEFHARYIFACEHADELNKIGLPFFSQFGNAQEIEAQFVTDAGAGAAEIGRDTAELSLN